MMKKLPKCTMKHVVLHSCNGACLNKPLLKKYTHTYIHIYTHTYHAVVSPKPGHMDWVRDFDFMLNLFSLPSPCNYCLFLRRTPYRSLRSYPRNRPLVNSWENQSLVAATVPQIFGHCTGSELKYVECTKYVRVQAWTRVCEQSVYVVCVPGWFIK